MDVDGEELCQVSNQCKNKLNKKIDQGEVLIQLDLQDRNRWSKHERGLRDKSKREGSYT
jgi:hypothetical protein